ncbi:MAG: hypothetical protein CLLPBCKN_004314 [Chroococcidiopsis cubana SAG 39.79]|nr:hypothetical protein [Chroococcidiopsis cubana SAG 39.79]
MNATIKLYKLLSLLIYSLLRNLNAICQVERLKMKRNTLDFNILKLFLWDNSISFDIVPIIPAIF